MRSNIVSRPSQFERDEISTILTEFRGKRSVQNAVLLQKAVTVDLSQVSHSTQEFCSLVSVERFTLLKESLIDQNTKVGHLAYSYPQKPSAVLDQILVRLDPKISSMFS